MTSSMQWVKGIENTWKQLFATVLMMIVISIVAAAQSIPTGILTGTVTDANGAVVASATVVVKNVETNAEYTVSTSDNGAFSIPSLAPGEYVANVTAQGFKQSVVKNIKVEVGKQANLTVSLEVGALNESVTVLTGADVLQTTSSTVGSNLTGRQISELPFATRDAMQLVVAQPGVQTPGVPRASSVNGLPKGSLNITLDGINIQDNLLKSSDGFFTSTQAKADAVSEVSLSTATPGAESAGGGAVQINFRTRSGTSEFHGSGFWQHRNTSLNANYYFNNIDGQPRDNILLNQYGGNVSGPILKNRLFFFFNYEEFTLPQTYPSSRTLLTDNAINGVYTYRDMTGTLKQVDLYALAAARNPGLPANVRPYPTTPDPTVSSLLGLFRQGASKGGVIRSRIATANDYNRLDYNFQSPGKNTRRFPTVRFDWNVNKNNQVEFVYHYQYYFSDPDGVNGQLPVVPGEGIVLGAPDKATGSIRRIAYSGAIAWRSTITPTLVNELRGTLGNGGIAIFGSEAVAGLFTGARRGYTMSFPFGSNPQTRSTQSRRHTPITVIYDNLTWQRGSHSMNFGMQFTSIKSFQQSVGTQTIPSITFGIAAGDPINTGTTAIFTTTNFPNSTSVQRGEAAALYALLTGRVSALGYSASLEDQSKQYKFAPFTEQNRQRELGFYAQDQWRPKSNLTLNYGLRWEIDFAPRNINGVYTTAGFESVWGVSGVGNLFKPGVFANTTVPQFQLVDKSTKPYDIRFNDFAPSFGFAWQPNWGDKLGFLEKIFGRQGQTVLRGGYSIAFVREGFNTFHNMWGANEGPTLTLNVTPALTPELFVGPGNFAGAGSVIFRDSILPRRLPPNQVVFPIDAGPGAAFNEWDPNLKMGYTQSWSFGIQRELTKNMALEIRYVGNHGTNLWQQLNLNEVNIFENGFLNEFKIAQNNLRIARAITPTSNNFGNQGLPGQQNIPIISTALGTTNDVNFATTIQRGGAGSLANSIAFNATRMNNLINANLVPFVTLPNGARVSNFFIVNPLATGGSFLVTNGGHTIYHAAQVEVRRRLSDGLLFDGSYTFAKSLTNLFNSSSVVFAQPTTMRDRKYDRGPSPFDLRHAFKINGIYELPIGPGRKWLSSTNPVINKVLEGWQVGGVARIQSGTALRLTSGRNTFNSQESGVVLYNITREELQRMVSLRKTPSGVVYWLPQSMIDNTLAAFELGGTLDPNAPYIGPPTTPGQLGARIFLYGPWQKRVDINILKRTRITERVTMDFRAQFLNAFNFSNIFIGTVDAVNSPILGGGGIGTQFGQTRSAYRDVTVSGTNDPGGRLVEFQIRLSF